MAAVQRSDLEADRYSDLGHFLGGGFESGEGRGGDAHDSGVEELAVPGHEFFLALLDGSGRSAVVSTDPESLLASLFGIRFELRGIAGDRALRLRPRSRVLPPDGDYLHPERFSREFDRSQARYN